jgi:YD repeat-containing protein
MSRLSRGTCGNLAAAVVGATAMLGSAVNAQSTGPLVPPSAPLTDENYVDFISGETVVPIKLVSLGSGDLGLSLTINYTDEGYFNADTGVYGKSGSLDAYWVPDSKFAEMHYHIGFKDTIIDTSGGSYSAYTDGGSAVVNPDGSRIFTDRNGTVMSYVNGVLTVKYPNGKLLTYYGNLNSQTGGNFSVLQNNGLLLKSNSSGQFTIVNLAYEYCNPDPTVNCSLTQSWPTATQSFSTSPPGLTVTDSAGGTYQFTTNGYAITSYHDKSWAPGVAITYQVCTRSPINCYWASSDGSIGGGQFQAMYDRVTSATKNGVTWSFNYVWNVGPHGYIYQTTSPIQRNLYGWSDPNFPPYTQSFQDGSGKSWGFDYAGRVTGWGWANGPGESYTYSTDGRANLIEMDGNPTSGSTTPAWAIHADFDATCIYPAKCNKPNDYIDANGNRTDYTYDNNTGLLTSESLPAVKSPSGTMIRPVTRYHYVQRSAWYLQGGAYTKDSHAIWLLDTEKTCRTGGTDVANDKCLVTGDEVVTAYDYGPDSGPNNLWLRGVAVTAGGVTHRTCYSYDRLGNKISETTPNANLSSCP